MRSFLARIAYRFTDYFFARPWFQIALVTLLGIGFVLLTSRTIPRNLLEASLLGYQVLLLLLAFTLIAMLTAMFVAGFNRHQAKSASGSSQVLETNHTLILGWNSRVFSVIKEVSLANLSRKKATIVVLAAGDKVEMEDEIKQQVGKIGRTKVVVRSGDPMSLADLEIVNHAGARSIIILSLDESENADLVTIKTALALVNNPNRKQNDYHIVAELKDLENLERAKLVSSTEVKWIASGDVLSRIMAQTSRQSGLSQIFRDLLDFDGDEIYFTSQPQLVGKTYLAAQHEFSNSSLIGVLRDSEVLLNPARTLKIKESDQLIVIAPDDSMIRTSDFYSFDKAAISNSKVSPPKPEKALVLGQSENLPVILSELEQYVAKGSSVTVVSDKPKMNLNTTEKLKLSFIAADPTSREALEKVKVQAFDHIIVLANRDLSAEESDAITLITLLQLRAIAKTSGRSFNIVTEMLDDRNRQLAESTEADDFIVSDQLIGLMMSQISENPDLAEVFGYLFSSEGSEISLHPASWYVKLGEMVDMHVLIEAAAKRGETAIGYRKADLETSQQNAYGVALNPEKVRRFKLVEGDKVIVLAEG
jgi:voltage-gated potassium channel Kch